MNGHHGLHFAKLSICKRGRPIVKVTLIRGHCEDAGLEGRGYFGYGLSRLVYKAT